MRWSLRSLLFVTFCVSAFLGCQLYVERRASRLERELSALDESTQSRLMQASDSLTRNTRDYSISSLQSMRHRDIVNFLFFRRQLSVNFRSTNHVGKNTAQSWIHAQEYVVRPWGMHLESTHSECVDLQKFGAFLLD